MPDLEQFGPRLRREREKRRITLEEIAASTNVAIELWDGLERHDFSRWPSGLFARAFVRDYARVVGLDPDLVVDEFCRHFPIGDRRANRIIKAQADLIGHPLEPSAQVEHLPTGRERRRRPPTPPAPVAPNPYRPRVVAAGIDLACVVAIGAGGAALFGTSFWVTAGVGAIVYFTAATVAAGASPGTVVTQRLQTRAPALFTNRRAVA